MYMYMYIYTYIHVTYVTYVRSHTGARRGLLLPDHARPARHARILAPSAGGAGDYLFIYYSFIYLFMSADTRSECRRGR